MSLSISTCLGISRHLTPKYADIKKNCNSSKNILQSIDTRTIFSESGKTTLLGKSNKSIIELKNTVLPPQYMDLFEKTTDYYNEILTKFTKLQEQQQKRITPKFNEDENKQLDRNIYNSIIEITKKIKNCEENIKQISIIQLLSVAENDMKNNIKIYLASKLQDISKKVRINEEEYIIKFKEFYSNDFKNFYSSGSDHLENSFQKQPKSFLDLDKSNEMLKQRDVEINNLVNSISNLTQIFQDLAALVQDQGIKNVNKGTILDRIDYNIEVSLENTKKANICLRKTEKNLDKNCARNSIMILIIVIFIEAILLLLKIVNK